jgi:hypothetical protein
MGKPGKNMDLRPPNNFASWLGEKRAVAASWLRDKQTLVANWLPILAGILIGILTALIMGLSVRH